ncbi:MAG: HTTM domain-containing protein [Polyangiaceae bacterium]
MTEPSAKKKRTRSAPPYEWFSTELIARLELVRVCAPLAILGFMSSRVRYADDWISDAGFCVPDLGMNDPHQSYYLTPLPSWAAWSVASALVVAGLCVCVGFRTRQAAALFAALLAYVALADRLAAFTVSRLAPVVALAICLSPAGTRFSVDAWLAWRRRAATLRASQPLDANANSDSGLETGGAKLPDEMRGGTIRFFQALLVVFYTASGICKARGDWLTQPAVLWTHLHDSYQTFFSYTLANTLPGFSWTVFQGMTLLFECFAFVWLAPRRLRPLGLVFGISMHTLIGLMFGPVIWFSLLMITLLCGSFLPDRLMQRLSDRLAELTHT